MVKDSEPTDTAVSSGSSLSGLGRVLMVFWVACFATIGAVTLAKVLDPSTDFELSGVELKAADGAWDLAALEAVCRQAIDAHGDDGAAARQVEYVPGELVGRNVSDPRQALTAWRIGDTPRRVVVYVSFEDGRARCTVAPGK